MKKKLIRYYFLPLISFSIAEHCNAEINIEDLKISLNAQYVALGDYEPSYDVLVGSEAEYSFLKKGDWHHFVKGGISGNIESSDSKLTIYDVGIGSRYHFFKAWNKDFFVDYSLGGAYHVEKFSTQLSDGVVNSTFNTWEYQAGIGMGVNFNEKLSSRIFINRLGSQGTAAGLDVSLKF